MPNEQKPAPKYVEEKEPILPMIWGLFDDLVIYPAGIWARKNWKIVLPSLVLIAFWLYFLFFKK